MRVNPIKSLMLAALVATSSLGSISSANAAIIWVDDGSSNIGTVDTVLGTSTVVGPSGVSVLTDIAFDPSQNLWGISFSSLYTINKLTGAASLVGALGVGDMNALTFAANGTLYGMGFFDTDLWTINTATGAATSVGNTGHQSRGDLAFHNGVLYASVAVGAFSNLISINPGTGTSTMIGQIVASGSLFGLVSGSDGVLYGVDGNKVYSINTATGAGLFVTTYGGPLGTANGAASPTEAVPEPGSLALFGFALLSLLGFGIARRRSA